MNTVLKAKTNPFTEDLEKRLSSVATFVEPGQKVLKGDHVLDGVEMDEYLRRMFTVIDNMSNDIAQKTERALRLSEETKPSTKNQGILAAFRSAFADHSPEVKEKLVEMERLVAEILSSIHECDAIRTLFWLELRRRHPELVDKGSIGVRTGWKICWSDDESVRVHHKVLVAESAEDMARQLEEELRETRNTPRD